jgi:hypothetical protein
MRQCEKRTELGEVYYTDTQPGVWRNSREVRMRAWIAVLIGQTKADAIDLLDDGLDELMLE